MHVEADMEACSAALNSTAGDMHLKLLNMFRQHPNKITRARLILHP